MSTEQQRQAWRELDAARTPGEWEAMEFMEGYGFVIPADNDRLHVIFHVEEINAANAAFIAAASTAVPALLADVERLTVHAGMATDTANKYLAKYEERVLRVSDLSAQVAALTAERDALAQQLQQAQDAAKRQAAYISACVDSDGCYRP